MNGPHKDKGSTVNPNYVTAIVLGLGLAIGWWAGCGGNDKRTVPEGTIKKGPGQKEIRFVEETITLNILPGGHFKVTGVYYFRNTLKGSKTITILYPFPEENGDYGRPEGVELTLGDSTRDCTNDIHKNRLLFHFPIHKGRVDSFRIAYRQKALRGKAKYILTTTRDWGRPLEQARFVIVVPATVPEVKINYPVDRTERQEGTRIYYFTKTGFMPDKDLIVSW